MKLSVQTLACVALLLAPMVSWSQAAAPATAKPAPAKTKTPAKDVPKAGASPSRVEARSTAGQLAAGIMAAEAALTPAELAIAERVYIGKLPCELGAFVVLAADPKSPGFFNVEAGKSRFRMFPVESRTGAIRLEDPKAGAVWLQLANKSMLMNQKLGQRLADECMSPAQMAVAEALKLNPAPNLLDPLPVKSAPAGTDSAAERPVAWCAVSRFGAHCACCCTCGIVATCCHPYQLNRQTSV